MSSRIPHDEVVSGRVTTRDKQLLKDSGFTVRDAVEFFLFHRSHPKRKLMVDKFIVSKNIKTLTKQKEDIEMEIISEERHLEAINKQLGIVELNGNEYSLDITQAVDTIIQRFERYSGTLDDFFTSPKYKYIVQNQEALLDLEDGEIKELVKAKICKQV